MRPAKRLVLLTAVCCLLLALLVVPATAYDTVTFTGTATICANSVTDTNNEPKPTAADCPIKPGQDQHNGLYILGHPNGRNTGPGGTRFAEPGSPKYHDKYLFRHGNYRFRSTMCTKSNPLADAGPVPCDLDVAGKIGPGPGGMGAACGFAAGHSGRGRITAENGSHANVWDVGWPATAGVVFPIKGDYHYKTGAKDPDKPHSGQFVGVVAVAWGAECVKSDVTGKQGASQFAITGVVVTTPMAKKGSPMPPKD